MCSSWENPLSGMLPVFSTCLQGGGPSKPVSQHPNPLLDSRGWAHQHDPALCHSTFHTHLTGHISNTQCPLVGATPIDSNHPPRVFLGGGGGYLLLMHPNQNTEGPGGGMCLIWSGKIWCKENLVPVFQIELILVAIISWRLLGCLLLLQTYGIHPN